MSLETFQEKYIEDCYQNFEDYLEDKNWGMAEAAIKDVEELSSSSASIMKIALRDAKYKGYGN